MLQLPHGSSAVQGPEQVFNKLSSNGTITKDLSLFNTAGGNSSVIHGNLLTLPIGNSFLYVEPLYTQGTGGGKGVYPQLQRIIAVYGDNVGYGETLANALSDFLPGNCTGHTLANVTCGASDQGSPSGGGGGTTTPPSSSTPTPTGSSTSPPPAGQQALLTQLNTAYDDLVAATKTGDFAKIGAAQEKLNGLVKQYLSQYGSLPGGSGTPGGSSSPSATPSK